MLSGLSFTLLYTITRLRIGHKEGKLALKARMICLQMIKNIINLSPKNRRLHLVVT